MTLPIGNYKKSVTSLSVCVRFVFYMFGYNNICDFLPRSPTLPRSSTLIDVVLSLNLPGFCLLTHYSLAQSTYISYVSPVFVFVCVGCSIMAKID